MTYFTWTDLSLSCVSYAHSWIRWSPCKENITVLRMSVLLFFALERVEAWCVRGLFDFATSRPDFAPESYHPDLSSAPLPPPPSNLNHLILFFCVQNAVEFLNKRMLDEKILANGSLCIACETFAASFEHVYGEHTRLETACDHFVEVKNSSPDAP